MHNLTVFEEEGRTFTVGPCGYVPHPRKLSLCSSLQFVRILGQQYIVKDKLICIYIPRQRCKRRKSFWITKPKRQSTRYQLSIKTIDTHKRRVVLGDGITATCNSVLYDAGCVVDWNLIATAHLERVRLGITNTYGDYLPGAIDNTGLQRFDVSVDNNLQHNSN